MKAFTTLTSIAVPILRDNIDTDTIIPSREMKSTGKTGLANGLFAPWRYRDMDSRDPDPDFALNDPAYRTAEILLSGENFGCGSSREHAVWALAEYGIRAIIAQSFAPIFENNCIRSGILPIALSGEFIAAIVDKQLHIDLDKQTVSSGSDVANFAIGAEAKMMLAEGLNVIELTMKHSRKIADWQANDRKARPWIYLGIYLETQA